MSRFAAYLRTLYTKNPINFALLCLLILTIPVGILFGNKTWPLRNDLVITPRVQENKTLIINNISPNGGVVLPQRITFTFSDPVDEHTFTHFLTIAPSVPGKIVKGQLPNQLAFIPVTPFEKGKMFSIKVASGLTSSNGKTLLADEVVSFSTELKDNDVQFVKGETAGRVLSFPAGKQVGVKARLAKNLTKTDVKLYASTQANLLNYLIYTRDPEQKDEFSSSGDTFIRNNIEHKESTLLKTFSVVNNQELQIDIPAGVYYLEAQADNGAPLGSSFLVVNTVGVTFRQDDKKIVLSTFDVASGKRVEQPADIGLYNLEDAPNQLATLSYTTIQKSYTFPFASRLDAIIGTIRGESIFIPVRLPESMADIQTTQHLDQVQRIFLYTDRPLYKPKDRVFFRGIVKVDGDGLYKLPPGGLPIKITLGYGEKPDVALTVQTDESGFFSGNFELPETLAGTQYLYASGKNIAYTYGNQNGMAYFDVAKYIKPQFALKTVVNKAEFIRNEQAEFTISGSYFDGKPYANQEISYAVYEDTYYETEQAVYNKNFNVTSEGGMCGGGFLPFEDYYGSQIEGTKKIKLDKNGRATVTFSLSNTLNGSKKITLVAMKKDQNGNDIISAANTIIHSATYNIFFMPSVQTYNIDDELVAPFYAESLTGEKLNQKELTYRLITTSYNAGKTIEETLHAHTVMTDSGGRGIIKLKLDKKFAKAEYLVIEGRDDKGNIAEARKYITLVTKQTDQSQYTRDRSSTKTFLKITSTKNNFQTGDKIVLTVQSPKAIDALLSLERGRVYYPELVSLKKGDNTVEIDVGEDLSPSITVVFSFFVDGTYYTEGLSLNVPAMHKVLQVSVVADKQTYKPTETAQITIKTKDADANPIPATLSMAVIDKALLTLRKSATPPIHSSFYYFRPRTTNASSSLTWVGSYPTGGYGGGGGGEPLGGLSVDTLYWNPKITTGTSGETVVPVPLEGFETTWKALVIGSTDDAQFGQGETEFISAE